MLHSASCPQSMQRQHAACSSRAAARGVCHTSRSHGRPQRRSQQHAVVCAAAAASEQALAIYAWPKSSPPVRQQQPFTRSPTKLWTTEMWFEAMVQTVVKQLDGAPFLLRVAVNPALRLELIRLQPADLAAGWEHIQQRHLSSAAVQEDEAVILVHPVAAADRPCLAGEACPGCPHTSAAEVAGAAAAAAATSAAAASAAAYSGGVTAHYAAPGSSSSSPTELLHGKFGECCDGHHHHHDEQQQQGHSQQPHSSSQPQQQQQPDSVTGYYGLVVQTRSALQGCYLLKTVKDTTGVSSCNCTHYTLTQVCQGKGGLERQYQDAWLV